MDRTTTKLLPKKIASMARYRESLGRPKEPQQPPYREPPHGKQYPVSKWFVKISMRRLVTLLSKQIMKSVSKKHNHDS